jgi:uncharacterized membrane protein
MIIAVVLALLAALLSGLSVTMQKSGITAAESFSVRGLLKSKRCVLGGILAVASFVPFVIALSMERLSIIQPLVSSSVLFAAVVGHHIKMEKVDAKGVLAIIAVFAGVVLLSVGG